MCVNDLVHKLCGLKSYQNCQTVETVLCVVKSKSRERYLEKINDSTFINKKIT